MSGDLSGPYGAPQPPGRMIGPLNPVNLDVEMCDLQVPMVKA